VFLSVSFITLNRSTGKILAYDKITSAYCKWLKIREKTKFALGLSALFVTADVGKRTTTAY